MGPKKKHSVLGRCSNIVNHWGGHLKTRQKIRITGKSPKVCNDFAYGGKVTGGLKKKKKWANKEVPGCNHTRGGWVGRGFYRGKGGRKSD